MGVMGEVKRRVGRAIDTVVEGCHEVICSICRSRSPLLFGGTREGAEARLAGELGWLAHGDEQWACPAVPLGGRERLHSGQRVHLSAIAIAARIGVSSDRAAASSAGVIERSASMRMIP